MAPVRHRWSINDVIGGIRNIVMPSDCSQINYIIIIIIVIINLIMFTQLKFYKVMSVPTLTYGSENWTLNKSDRRKIEAAEMRFFRSVAGFTLLDHKRSEDIRAELKIFNLNDKLLECKEDWKEHIERMPEDRFPKLLLNYTPVGRRSIGRPYNRWEDQFL
ncbi:hypothetical protein ANN_12352 [Periplaneta americana]|uniref:Uncharacterized protein n=1 Tax=Periplaneta americana TaxID=6978 RepID=A0ABQ8TIF0_PERAM|nr:hypothetical protein ANN_12352 [Periplaneta americana]